MTNGLHAQWLSDNDPENADFHAAEWGEECKLRLQVSRHVTQRYRDYGQVPPVDDPFRATYTSSAARVAASYALMTRRNDD